MIRAFDRRAVLISVGQESASVSASIVGDKIVAVYIIDGKRRIGAGSYRDGFAVLRFFYSAQANSLHRNHFHLLDALD
ncbi:hypothetical protein ATE62_07905 [Sphingopyxis sp. HIX]|nr:hypothetical protein ATE62_07905 [Sphingopyxis sp. HIX]KTE85084.1 hypothetical protein ATE72_05265 [Sphingopyxis sp. HXXIV]